MNRPLLNYNCNLNKGLRGFCVAIFLMGYVCHPMGRMAYAQEEEIAVEDVVEESDGKVELSGDTVEYLSDGNMIHAQGNVEIVYKGMTLACDEVEFDRENQIANAIGDVSLTSGQGAIYGEKIVFNYKTMEGDLNGAKLVSKPFYGRASSFKQVSKDQMDMNEAAITTCDLDKPHFHLASKKIEIYPDDKIVARHVKMVFGKIPLLYIPKFSRPLSDAEPRFTFTPGYKKEWGGFLLTQWRYDIGENLRGKIHVDYRSSLDLAVGLDAEYDTKKFGTGLFRTYYTNERKITSDYPWQPKPSPTVETERFKAEWRHKWKVDDTTTALLQYYKLSDSTFLKDYFEREYEKDPNPDTYFLLSKSLPKGTLSFRTDVRVNRFESKVERLPQVSYNLPNSEIFDTNFFLRNITTYDKLTKKSPSPSEIRDDTQRVYTDNELSYPFKLAFLELAPFVGGNFTYYSKTNDPDYYNSIRGAFRTGASVSTKFYRMFETQADFLGIKIDRLRHIITPSVDYIYKAEPTIDDSIFDQYDGVDSQSNAHRLLLSFENKFQTKRNGRSVDFLRAVVETPFLLKEDPGSGGFGNVFADIDFHPSDWFTLYFDSEYDTTSDRLKSSNIDAYINGSDWRFGVGKRYNREVDDQLTANFDWRINPKWALGIYQRFDLDTGTHYEQNYRLVRDLHEWEMEININERRTRGIEFFVLFRLKAFPDIGFDVGQSFDRRDSGSQQ